MNIELNYSYSIHHKWTEILNILTPLTNNHVNYDQSIHKIVYKLLSMSFDAVNVIRMSFDFQCKFFINSLKKVIFSSIPHSSLLE